MPCGSARHRRVPLQAVPNLEMGGQKRGGGGSAAYHDQVNKWPSTVFFWAVYRIDAPKDAPKKFRCLPTCPLTPSADPVSLEHTDTKVIDLAGRVLKIDFWIDSAWSQWTGAYQDLGSATNQIGVGYWDFGANWTASAAGFSANFGGWEGNQGSFDNASISWSNLTKTGIGSYNYGNAYTFVDENYEYKISNMSYAFSVPEPGSWMMIIFGFALLGGALRCYQHPKFTCV